MLFPPAEYQSQTRSLRRPLTVWLLTLAGVLLFVAQIIVAPLAAASNHYKLAFAIYRPFGVLCHQLPERSFFIAGHQLAVCARCTGLYVGFVLVLMLYPLVRSLRVTTTPDRKFLFWAAVPLVVDFSLTFFGIWENTHTSRFLTGLLLGGVTVLYVVPGMVELSQRTWGKQLRTPDTFTLVSPESIASAPSDYSAPSRRI